MRSKKHGLVSFLRLCLFLIVCWTISLNLSFFYGKKAKANNDVKQVVLNPHLLLSDMTSSTLPLWMQQYLQWHARQSHNDSSVQYLIVRCLNQDTHCGGTADRLMPLPLFVMMAARMKRVLLFHWERPCSLDEFLIPSTTVDWRIPSDFELFHSLYWKSNAVVHISHQVNVLHVLDPDYVPPLRRKSKPLPAVLPRVVTIAYQSQLHGADIYNQFRNRTELLQANFSTANVESSQHHTNKPTPSFEQLYSALWNVFFQPSPRIQYKINSALQELQLIPDQYVAAHIRALYQQEAGPKKTALVARNAMHCASQLLSSYSGPQIMIYVVSDSINSTTAATAYIQQEHSEEHVAVVTRSSTSVVHLDRGTAFLEKDADQWTKQEHCADYDDTFVDLYLLILAKCRSVHLGSFAKWAHLIHGGNCINSHFQQQCRWKKSGT